MPFRSEFSKVINMRGKRDINGVIDKLRGAVGVELPYFQDAAKSLPVINAAFTDANNGKIQSVTVRRIGGGTYGTIWQGTGPSSAVYKRTVNKTKGLSTAEVEAVYRENYVEAFIQTVLQSDPSSGESVGNLEAIYRDATIRRRGTRRRSSGARRTSSNKPQYNVRRASSEPLNTTFFYKMEYIRYTFADAIQKLYTDAGGPIPLDVIHSKFGSLGETLTKFDENYGFRHCDLHTGNLMFTGAMDIKLIDFGKSCLNIDGVVYAKNKTVCESYDLLIFLASLREYYFQYFDAGVRDLINYFFTDTDGTNIYDEIERFHTDFSAQGAVFHYFYRENSIDDRADPDAGYPWGEDVGGRTLYDKLMAGVILQKVSPEHFSIVWENPRAPRPALVPALPPLPASPASSSSANSLASSSNTVPMP